MRVADLRSALASMPADAEVRIATSACDVLDVEPGAIVLTRIDDADRVYLVEAGSAQLSDASAKALGWA